MSLLRKSIILTGAALLLVISASQTARAIGDGWIMDFEKAKQQATAENKDILMDFTGSDWCGWCIRLDKEVFSQDAFKEEAPKHFVLLALDYPNDKSKLAQEIQDQNARLMSEYGVQGFPTIFLTDAQGVPYAQTGYKDGGPEKYLEHLKELKDNLAQTQALIKKAEDKDLSDADKAKILDEALGKVQNWDITQKRYAAVVDQIIALDKDNALQLKSKYEQKQAIGGIEALKAKRDYSAAIARIDEVIKSLQPTGQLAQDLLFMKGECNFYLQDRVAMRENLQKALEAAPEGDKAEMIRNNLARFAAPTEEPEPAEAPAA